MMLNLKEWIAKVSNMLGIVETATPTITNYNVYDSTGTGSIILYKWGRVCTLKFNAVKFKATTARTDFMTIPADYRPIIETGGIFDSSTTWFFVRPTGTVAINDAAASTRWGAVTYLTQG